MTYDLQTLLLIEVDTMAVLVSLVCGVLMWRNRREVPDRSRIILFLITLTALPIIGKVISLMTHGLNNRFVEVLPIVLTIMGTITIVLMLLYAIEVMRPNWEKLIGQSFLPEKMKSEYGCLLAKRIALL